jgi:hypothetical protein
MGCVFSHTIYDMVHVWYIYIKVAGEESVSGLEAVFQIIRSFLLLSVESSEGAFVFEQDAMERAVAMLVQLQVLKKKKEEEEDFFIFCITIS